MRVFLTGGTGFIGTALSKALIDRGDEVVVLTRSKALGEKKLTTGVEVVEGISTQSGDWQESLSGVDAVVNLAGESVAKQRWDARFKQVMRDSRVETTRFVVEAIAALEPPHRPRVLLSSSGIDYYPFSLDIGRALPVDVDIDVTETMPPGDSTLARICRAWEAEAAEAAGYGVRTCFLRFGVVLGEGGPLSKMTTPFKFFVGGRLGKGRQWFSWIHLKDLVRAILFLLDNSDVRGAVNLVAPNPVRNREFSRSLGKAISRPSWIPVPVIALRAVVGEFHEYLVHGRRAMPEVLRSHGFTFDYGAIDVALADIFS